MTMKLKDFASLKGEVLIQSINEFGEISTLVEDKNLIVSYGRNNICNGLVGNPSSYVYDVVFGNGGTIPGNVNVALSVLPGEVAVKSPISASNGKDYIFTKVAETSPSPRAIFSIVLPKLVPSTYSNQSYITSLNGQGISEIALMLNTSPTANAFAIKRFPSISKSDLVSIIITWTIYV